MLVALVALLQQATYTGILISGSKRKGKTGNSMNLSFNIWNLQIVLYIEAWKPALQEKNFFSNQNKGHLSLSDCTMTYSSKFSTE